MTQRRRRGSRMLASDPLPFIRSVSTAWWDMSCLEQPVAGCRDGGAGRKAGFPSGDARVIYVHGRLVSGKTTLVRGCYAFGHEAR
jgi:hypothetical protein